MFDPETMRHVGEVIKDLMCEFKNDRSPFTDVAGGICLRIDTTAHCGDMFRMTARIIKEFEKSRVGKYASSSTGQGECDVSFTVDNQRLADVTLRGLMKKLWPALPVETHRDPTSSEIVAAIDASSLMRPGAPVGFCALSPMPRI